MGGYEGTCLLEFIRTEILKLIVISVLNTKCIILVTSFLIKFFENCKDGNDMGRLKVVMRSEIQFFFCHCHCIHFMGLVLQLVNPFMPVGNNMSKKVLNKSSVKAADLFKNV